jgi:hypothetical protein
MLVRSFKRAFRFAFRSYIWDGALSLFWAQGPARLLKRFPHSAHYLQAKEVPARPESRALHEK